MSPVNLGTFTASDCFFDTTLLVEMIFPVKVLEKVSEYVPFVGTEMDTVPPPETGSGNLVLIGFLVLKDSIAASSKS
jgi:hypothetical protein